MSKQKRLLYLEWDDHSSFDNKWRDEKFYCEQSNPLRCKTIGWVLKEDDESITIASTIVVFPDNTDDAKSDQTIIKSCIRKRRRINIP